MILTSNFKSSWLKSSWPFDRDIKQKKLALAGTAIEVFITVYSYNSYYGASASGRQIKVLIEVRLYLATVNLYDGRPSSISTSEISHMTENRSWFWVKVKRNQLTHPRSIQYKSTGISRRWPEWFWITKLSTLSRCAKKPNPPERFWRPHGAKSFDLVGFELTASEWARRCHTDWVTRQDESLRLIPVNASRRWTNLCLG